MHMLQASLIRRMPTYLKQRVHFDGYMLQSYPATPAARVMQTRLVDLD